MADFCFLLTIRTVVRLCFTSATLVVISEGFDREIVSWPWIAAVIAVGVVLGFVVESIEIKEGAVMSGCLAVLFLAILGILSTLALYIYGFGLEPKSWIVILGAMVAQFVVLVPLQIIVKSYVDKEKEKE